MAIRVSSLQAGDVVSIEFKGSRSLGNEPHVLDDLVVDEVIDGETIVLRGSGHHFSIYKYGRRWAYGSSAEPLSVLTRVRPEATV